MERTHPDDEGSLMAEEPLVNFDDEFYYDTPKFPLDFEGNPAYLPTDYAHPSWQKMTRWEDLDPRLRSEDVSWFWMHPNTNWKVWHIAGPREGTEGVVMAKGLSGVDDLEFEHRYSNGPYLIGAERERTDYQMGVVDIGFVINPPVNVNRKSSLTAQSGKMAMLTIEDSFRQSFSDTVPGFLGCWTRASGLRWIPAIKGAKWKRDSEKSPMANGNAVNILSTTLHMPWPLYAKMAITDEWRPDPVVIQRDGFARHTFSIANKGTFECAAKFIVRGTSRDDITIDGKKGYGVRIQNGTGGNMIPIPNLLSDDGDYVFVDTDPSRQTLTTELEPIDGQIYRTLRQSQFLELLLKPQLDAKLPIQRRIPGGIDFDAMIPPKSVAHIDVTHTNAEGSVEMIVPQYYRSSWS
ncbi:minor tail protein [Mycobacterium phage FlagStaff]|uniref:Minor tail protein n=1 Tax=Mycobacterium phage FlagStaff TaxID=1647304 RepID=A0A0F6WE17_9CAUD|nr:minor tail protein [Mycobacterium phage FlagStaff]AKF14454.1 minor tail protein [Mycobacterium phage FlagStaff]